MIRITTYQEFDTIAEPERVRAYLVNSGWKITQDLSYTLFQKGAWVVGFPKGGTYISTLNKFVERVAYFEQCKPHEVYQRIINQPLGPV